MSSASEFLMFWGKARSRSDSAITRHPVAYHLLDVAAVAGATTPVALAR
ncbi:MAG: hypothetical protein H0W30_02410 [Gemmatimonadaceae bacterium]|nr:hypothetical protein [Gemmatimonadaceae bacterium]